MVEMNELDLTVGYCGVCCNHCGMHSRIPKMAEELRRFVQAYKYSDWIAHVTQDFRFGDFMKGLNWFAETSCNGCPQDGGVPDCEVRTCCREKGFRNCYFCPDFEKCEKLCYQKTTYRIDDSHVRIGQIGYENWLKEQKEKTSKGFDNIHFLE
jgi:hypothetical protein